MSPPEILPSPEICAPGVPELESPASAASSISQGELVERDIELELPSPPPSLDTQPEDMDVASPDIDEPLDNRPSVTFGDDVDDDEKLEADEEELDEESLQKVAMEVTTKAVQDAIKIVTENGNGVGLTALSNDDNNDNNNNSESNGVPTSSPSSDDHMKDEEDEEEDMTTNSSQVERGSSVSDLTDTSQQGSIAESLSSYDPGAIFRQDLADLSDAVSAKSASPAEQDTATTGEGNGFEPSSIVSAALSVDVNSLQSPEESKSVAETPTPTNVTSFAEAEYPEPPSTVEADGAETTTPNGEKSAELPPAPQEPNGNDDTSDLPPPPPLPSAPESVPSSLPDIDPISSSKPTIVINSPDSAPNTNGSSEELSSTTQSEALI